MNEPRMARTVFLSFVGIKKAQELYVIFNVVLYDLLASHQSFFQERNCFLMIRAQNYDKQKIFAQKYQKVWIFRNAGIM